MDSLIRNGRVVDGTGNPWFKADVGITDGKISDVGKLNPAKAQTIIDAKHQIVCPGFIDIHSHSEFKLLLNPRAESKIRQGVTTELEGNCGFSPAPITSDQARSYALRDPLYQPTEVPWSSIGQYLDCLQHKGIALNVATLVGHGTVRVNAMGLEERAATGEEVNRMKSMVREAMEEGAFGLSTGLAFPPGCFAQTDEIVELAKTAAEFGGIYSSDIRNESAGLMDAVKEAIEIGEKGHILVQMSHHKSMGRPFWGKVKDSLRLIEVAREMGIDVAGDVYPYLRAAGGMGEHFLPPWVYEGGKEKALTRLQNPETRERIRRESEKGYTMGFNVAALGNWDDFTISDCEERKEYEGKTIAEIAKLKGADPWDVMFDLVIETRDRCTVLMHLMSEEDVQTVMKHPAMMIGTDGRAVAPYGILAAGKPHPRFYGVYPRVFRRYVKEQRILTLEEAIRKCTSFPAQRLSLRDRGLIRNGMWADIVVFDPNEIKDMATYADPHKYGEGISYVLVNGQVVIETSVHTGCLPGKTLRSSSAA